MSWDYLSGWETLLRMKRHQLSSPDDYPSLCPTAEIQGTTDRVTLQQHTSDIYWIFQWTLYHQYSGAEYLWRMSVIPATSGDQY